MTDTKEQLVVRLKYNPQSGWKMRRYCYLGHVFRAGPDWTPVSHKVAAHLHTVRADPSNDHALPAFEIMTQTQANELLEAERERQRPSMPGDNRPVVGGTPASAPSSTQALADLIGRMRRGEELTEEEEDLIWMFRQLSAPPEPSAKKTTTPQTPLEGRSLLDEPAEDEGAPEEESSKGSGKKGKKKRK